ncbi:uncharacterized protein SCHCODRAFT_01320312 [Schizophyllum commune H4-8]|uniref:uncharacterized protein n=1 Tax=Schizophyllum commune (strain H4-8 / FGSC 9210) TaxID=578458 RepID=UPI00215F08FC|nr:uncharacterized protein SCHCODRAFT_01320312 [Schizophyllum commune H4-8]KAI5890706.1 hypothetical protein SCHCODRAFT_01320312 [Schizophyllum commune H4-8]
MVPGAARAALKNVGHWSGDDIPPQKARFPALRHCATFRPPPHPCPTGAIVPPVSRIFSWSIYFHVISCQRAQIQCPPPERLRPQHGIAELTNDDGSSPHALFDPLRASYAPLCLAAFLFLATGHSSLRLANSSISRHMPRRAVQSSDLRVAPAFPAHHSRPSRLPAWAHGSPLANTCAYNLCIQ